MGGESARLEGRGLGCARDGRTLFRDLDLSLAGGEVLQVEGANGAGKTTLLKVLCGLVQPQAGEVHWRGEDIVRCRSGYHAELLYIGHSPGIKDELTAVENLRFFRSLGDHAAVDEALEEALEAVSLFGYEDVPVRALSAGQRRRVALSRLWLSEAPLWVLDEPFTAIDRRGVTNLEARLAAHAAAGGLALLTSHQPLHLEAVDVRRLGLG